jgi:RimJ/RimL family protein N-acetyltransferase
VCNILISLGTTNPGGITAEILDEVVAAAPGCAVDVVLGPQAESSTQVGERSQVSIHVSSNRMAELMRDCDLAIGAAGATSWERCCLGLPTILIVLAENQRAGAAALSASGAAHKVGNVGEIGAALRLFLDDANRLSRMSAAAFAITDGLGTERVVRSMLGNEDSSSASVTLRPATIEDAERIWLWRNDPVTRSHSRNSDPVPWKYHFGWFSNVLSDLSPRLMIAEQDGRAAGMIRFDPLSEEDAFEVSISVAPELRGSGIGTAILKEACDRMRTSRVHASIREDNHISRRIFEACGFRPRASAEAGFRHYVLTNDAQRKHA